MRKIVGLLSDQKKTGKVIERLSELNISSGVRLITPDMVSDEPRLRDSHQLRIAREMGTSTASVPQAAKSRTVDPRIEQDAPRFQPSNLPEALAEQGVKEDEADFYARGILKGGSLLIVDVDSDRRSTVRSVLREFEAVMPEAK